jgi:hypothetical protein
MNLQIGDSVCTLARYWGDEWARSEHGDNWRKARVRGIVVGRRGDLWVCDFGEPSADEYAAWGRAALWKASSAAAPRVPAVNECLACQGQYRRHTCGSNGRVEHDRTAPMADGLKEEIFDGPSTASPSSQTRVARNEPDQTAASNEHPAPHAAPSQALPAQALAAQAPVPIAPFTTAIHSVIPADRSALTPEQRSQAVQLLGRRCSPKGHSGRTSSNGRPLPVHRLLTFPLLTYSHAQSACIACACSPPA